MIYMIISDATVATSMTILSFLLIVFLRAARDNRGRYRQNSAAADHFLEHMFAGIIAFIGSIIATVAAITHLFLQAAGSLPVWVEYMMNLGESILFIAASLFVLHMIKEEDPTHPFHHGN